jgi:class 3 adenylate cyclase
MFCDLVGSTALASHLDPEDMRDVIGAYHRCVAETVRRFDGAAISATPRAYPNVRFLARAITHPGGN